MKFSELSVEASLSEAIQSLGYQDMTPIQAATIPHISQGRDIAGLAQTGTGKTAAFLIPLMDRVLKGQKSIEGGFADWRFPQFVLILVPTRELAEQVFENINKLGSVSNLKGVSIYGGTSYEKQKEGLKAGAEFVVATPGRLIDLYKENLVDLKQVRAIVFDEADRMFDMGFKDDMKYILQRVPRERQFLVFSATLNFDVLNTAYQFGAEPIEIDVSRDQAKAENVKDEIFHVGHDEKLGYVISLLKKHNPKQVIVFSNYKMNVERIAEGLSRNGFPAMGISSLLSQSQRNRALDLFKSENEKNILVATDVAARGLDIKGVDMVINFDLPQDAESYVHRIGRTGRAGTEGRAFSLVSDRDVESLSRVESYLKHKVSVGWLDDSELTKDYKPLPAPRRDDDDHRRGDNREGPRRDSRGGGRRDSRGPRRDDRGPRPEGGSARPPRGGARHGHKGPGAEQIGQQGQRQQTRRPERADRSGSGSQQNGRSNDHSSKNFSRNKPQGSARPSGMNKNTKPKVPAAVVQKSWGQKVGSFFKKIFGR